MGRIGSMTLTKIKANIKLNELQAPDGVVAMDTQKFSGLGAGTAQSDSMRKGQAEVVLADLVAAVCSETEAKGFVTKEFIVPVTFATEMANKFGFPVGRCNAINDMAYMCFKAPHDFTTIVSAEIIVIPASTQGAADWDVDTWYGAVGEAYSNHTGTNSMSTYGVTTSQLFAMDISSTLADLTADDYVGVWFTQSGDGHNVDVVGIRFKYT